MAKPTRLVVGLVMVIFLVATVGPWAWFSMGAKSTDDRFAFDVRETIPGWTFRPEPVGPTALATLGTTNLFNGQFVADDGKMVAVFSGKWFAESARSMSVVQHTPDICWVGAGWEPVDAGQPRQVRFSLGNEEVPFECRAFATPGQGHRELVVWCTLVGGRVLPESGMWKEAEPSSGARRERAVNAYRRVAVEQFLGNIRNQRLGSGDKQFIRFSMALRGEWKTTLEELEQFAGQWLSFRIRSAHPSEQVPRG